MSFDLDTLYNLLPAIYQIRDQEQRTRSQLPTDIMGTSDDSIETPLRALLKIFAEQIGILEEDLAQLYDDQFIETCAEWTIPYIGDLVGYHTPHRVSTHQQRAEVANTIAYRKRKGTVSLIEQLAQDITGWNVWPVEYFQRIASTQHLNNLHPHNTTIHLRHGQDLALQHSPFERFVHTVDLRTKGANSQPYNLPNLALFLWRLKAYPVQDIPATQTFSHDKRRYLFSPLGNPLQLFSRADRKGKEQARISQALTRHLLKNNLADYYGQNKSLQLSVQEKDARNTLLIETISVADLRNREDARGNLVLDSHGHPLWSNMPEEGVAIDPVLGRIAFAPTAPEPEELHISFYYGFSHDLGGGLYPRSASFDLPTLLGVQEINAKTLNSTLQNLQGDAAIELTESRVYPANLHIKTRINQRIELRAADLQRPLLHLTSDTEEAELQITGETGSEVILNGLTLYHGPIRVHGKLERLILRHCTLLPGLLLDSEGEPVHPGRPSLIVDIPDVEVVIDHSIVGTLFIHERSSVFLTNSIVDATRLNAVAFVAPSTHPPQAGGALGSVNSTIIGRVYTTALDALNTVFAAEPDAEENPPIVVMRRQEGSVRYSFTPANSRLPRVYGHRPEEQERTQRYSRQRAIHPLFSSLRYGEPGYCQLQQLTHTAIRQGAENRAEMGVYNELLQPQREANLYSRLGEYLRFDVKPTLIYRT